MKYQMRFKTLIAALALCFVAEGAAAETVLKLGTVGRLGMPIGDAIDQALIPTLEEVSGGKLTTSTNVFCIAWPPSPSVTCRVIS